MTPFPRTLRLNGQRLNVSAPAARPAPTSTSIRPPAASSGCTGRASSTRARSCPRPGEGQLCPSSVRIQHADFGRQLAVGERVLIGPITYHPAGSAGRACLAGPARRPLPTGEL